MHKLKSLLGSIGLGREEGQVLPMFAAGALAMLLMTGVVVDGGNLFQNRQSLQNAADAAAIAAALYLADSTNPCQAGAPDGIGACAGMYAGLNGVKNANGTTTTTQLSPCGVSVTDTTPPPDAPGCYVYPYDNNKIEVWLTQKPSNFFGTLLGFATSTESARAIGVITAGNPPPIAFAALDNSCDNHTLLIKLGGNLVVNSGIYVNSCNDHDGFDVFGGGSLTAPNIKVHGGWETHNTSKVYVPAGTQCTAPHNPDYKIFWPPGYNPTPPGCPDVGQSELLDPFANFPPAPALGAGNVGLPVSITKVSRGLNGVAANIANAVTASPHGLQAGDSVTISGLGFGFDGSYTVATAPDATTFTYSNSGPNLPIITGKQMSGGTATLTTNAPTTLSPGGPDTSVTVSGIDTAPASFFNFSGLLTGPPSSGSTSSFSYQPTYTDDVSQKGLQQGTAKLKVATTKGLAVNDTVSVSGVDSLLNAPANNPVTITAIQVGTPGTISYADPATTQYSISSASITNGTAASAKVNITTSAINHIFTNDGITVSGSGDSRINGSQSATSNGGNTTLTYTIPGLTATATSKAVSGGTVTVTTTTAPPFLVGDTVNFNAGGLAYRNTSATVTAVDSTAHTFSFAAPTFSTSSWSRSGTTVTITTAIPPGGTGHGLVAGNTVNVTFTGAQACLTVSGATVLTAPTLTTFTYTVPSTCTPGNGGNGTVKLVTAATNVSTVVAYEISGSTTASCSNCVTAPGFITANTPASGSVTLIDEPFNADTGTFTPAWMPTFGISAENLPGSAAIPSPKLISTGTTTLNPGTYYGGLCIGAPAGMNCGTNGVPANCKAAGGTTTVPVPYQPAVTVSTTQTADDTLPAYNQLVVSAPGPITVGDLIAIDDEEETVTAINGNVLTVIRADNGTEEAVHTAGTPVLHVVATPNGTPYSPTVALTANITAAATTAPVNSIAAVGVDDVIQIDNEAMTVTAINAATKQLTVTRGTYGTTPAAHLNKAPVLKVFDASAPPPPTVTLSKGVYIMAGGGFAICGAANVSAPNGVMIYNTKDPVTSTGFGALNQININTAGSVHLHPMTDGTYAGLTIFQDRALTLVPGKSCGGKSTDPNQWDIALQSAAPLPASGALGSISGTIYAPHSRSDFGDTMSGTANLAVITSCIYINGANSTFNHNPNGGGLFGVSATLGG